MKDTTPICATQKKHILTENGLTIEKEEELLNFREEDLSPPMSKEEFLSSLKKLVHTEKL